MPTTIEMHFSSGLSAACLLLIVLVPLAVLGFETARAALRAFQAYKAEDTRRAVWWFSGSLAGGMAFAALFALVESGVMSAVTHSIR